MFWRESLAALNHLPLWRMPIRVWESSIRPPSLDRLASLLLHRGGFMGAAERVFLRSVIKEGFYIVDVGANQGLYTLFLSRLTGSAGRVDAFEPDPLLFHALQENCVNSQLRNISVHNCALGASNGRMWLRRSLLNSGDNRLASADELGEGISVPVCRMDDFLTGDRAPDFVKIDVQGWEPAVFDGMVRLLAPGAPLRVYFEVWPYGMRAAGFEPEALLCKLLDHGFRLRHPSSVMDLDRDGVVTFLKSLRGKRFDNLYATR